MATLLGGYQTSEQTSQDALKGITITTAGTKTFLDVLPFFSPLDEVYENSDGQPIYEGFAPPGSATTEAVWAIKKTTYDSNGSVLTVRWADGVTTFSKVWDDRASYDYTP